MSFNLSHIWTHMGPLSRGIAFVLFMMAVSFIGVTIERLIAFSRSAKESRLFAVQAGIAGGKCNRAIGLLRDDRFLNFQRTFEFQHNRRGNWVRCGWRSRDGQTFGSAFHGQTFLLGINQQISLFGSAPKSWHNDFALCWPIKNMQIKDSGIG